MCGSFVVKTIAAFIFKCYVCDLAAKDGSRFTERQAVAAGSVTSFP